MFVGFWFNLRGCIGDIGVTTVCSCLDIRRMLVGWRQLVVFPRKAGCVFLSSVALSILAPFCAVVVLLGDERREREVVVYVLL